MIVIVIVILVVVVVISTILLYFIPTLIQIWILLLLLVQFTLSSLHEHWTCTKQKPIRNQIVNNKKITKKRDAERII